MKQKISRKEYPLFRGLAMYFPNALRAVSHLSLVGNQQHHKDEPLHWDRSKSTDEPDALMRHLLDAGIDWTNRDEDGELHVTKVAWRALAMLEKTLEREARDIKHDHCDCQSPTGETFCECDEDYIDEDTY